MATNIAEVLKLAAIFSTAYNHDERIWLDLPLLLENYFTHVNEKYVALLPDAQSQTVANVPAGTGESPVLFETLSHTLYALLATQTTERCLRLLQRAPKQEWVRSFGTAGVRERTKNSGSMILDVASCVAADNGWQSDKVRGHVESTGTSGGSLRHLRGVKAGRRRGSQRGAARSTIKTPRQVAGEFQTVQE